MKSIGPISPKAHGAYLGAGTGSLIANDLIQLIQQYITHAALAPSLVTLIYTVVPALLAFVGAYVTPAIPVTLLEQTRQEIVKTHWPSVPPGGAS
jgi:hypothetical protein